MENKILQSKYVQIMKNSSSVGLVSKSQNMSLGPLPLILATGTCPREQSGPGIIITGTSRKHCSPELRLVPTFIQNKCSYREDSYMWGLVLTSDYTGIVGSLIYCFLLFRNVKIFYIL